MLVSHVLKTLDENVEPKKPTNWLAGVFAAVAIMTAGTIGYKSFPPPDRTAPEKPPAVSEEVVPPRDKVPDPLPDPTPVPVVDPVAAITVVDAQGTPITDEIGRSKMIIVSSEKAVHGNGPLSIVWIIDPPMQKHISPGASEMSMVTPETDSVISIMQIVALDSKISYQKIKIKCGTGNVPPPNPDPVPPTPDPTPVVKSRNVFLAVVADYKAIPVDSKIVMNAIGVWNSFRSDGKSDWRMYDVTTGEVKGKKAVADALKANIPPPSVALVVYDADTGVLIDAVKLPTSLDETKPDSLQAVVSRYKGTK